MEQQYGGDRACESQGRTRLYESERTAHPLRRGGKRSTGITDTGLA